MNIKILNRLLVCLFVGFALGYISYPKHTQETKNTYFENFKYEMPFYGLTLYGSSESYIDQMILKYGAYERPVLHALRDISKLMGKDKTHFIDIGANTGQHSLFMSLHAKKVYSIEPYPPVLDIFKNNITKNSISNIEVFPVGFSDSDTTLPFYLPPDNNTGVGSFSKKFSEYFDGEDDKGKYIQLPIVVADQYLSKRSITKIDLVKIDIEGHEKHALLGMSETLNKNRPIIVMELTYQTDDGFTNAQDILSTLPAKYNLYEISYPIEANTSGDYSIKQFSESNKAQRNILLVPDDKIWIVDKLD